MPNIKRKHKINSDKIPSTFGMSLEEKLVLIANLVIDKLENDNRLWIELRENYGVKK